MKRIYYWWLMYLFRVHTKWIRICFHFSLYTLKKLDRGNANKSSLFQLSLSFSIDCYHLLVRSHHHNHHRHHHHQIWQREKKFSAISSDAYCLPIIYIHQHVLMVINVFFYLILYRCSLNHLWYVSIDTWLHFDLPLYLFGRVAVTTVDNNTLLLFWLYLV